MKLAAVLALLGAAFKLVAAAGYDLSPFVNDDGVVIADEALIDNVFRGTRDYAVVLLLTAEGPGFECAFCDTLGPDLREVARNWKREHGAEENGGGLRFMVVNVANCRPVFTKLGLASAPNIAIYPAVSSAGEGNRGLNAKHEFVSFFSGGSQIEHLKGVLGEVGFHVKIVKPFPWKRFSKLMSTVILGLVGAYLFRAPLLRVLQAKQPWLSLCLVAVIIFTSGHMFNVTRGTPFTGQDGQGRPILFENGFNIQFAIETQLIAVVYAVLSFATIVLVTRAPKLPAPTGQSVAAIICIVIILLAYSVLIETFKMKYYGYPFSLLRFNFWKLISS